MYKKILYICNLKFGEINKYIFTEDYFWELFKNPKSLFSWIHNRILCSHKKKKGINFYLKSCITKWTFDNTCWNGGDIDIEEKSVFNVEISYFHFFFFTLKRFQILLKYLDNVINILKTKGIKEIFPSFCPMKFLEY